MEGGTGVHARTIVWAVLVYALGTLLAWLIAPWLIEPGLLPLTRPVSAAMLALLSLVLLLGHGPLEHWWARGVVAVVGATAAWGIAANLVLGTSVGVSWGGPWSPYLGDRSPWVSGWSGLPIALLCLAMLAAYRYPRTTTGVVLTAIVIAYGSVIAWVAGAGALMTFGSGTQTLPLTQVATIALCVGAARIGVIPRVITYGAPDGPLRRRWDILILGSALVPVVVVGLLNLARELPAVSTTVGNALVGLTLAVVLVSATWRAILVDRTLRHAQREALEEAEHLALHDPLTNLANRTLAMEALTLAMARARRAPHPVTVLFCDLDGLKRVNDAFGHAMGDRVIIAVADRLMRAVRDEDVVARLGGDEFLVITERLDSHAERIAFAERVLASVSAPVEMDGAELHPAISVGVAVAGEDEHPIEVIRNADAAMYKAKANGRGRWEVYDPAMRRELEQRRQLESEMRIALMGREIEVHVQSIVRLADHRVVAAEALARWHHPKRGLMNARSWLDIAEESAHVVAIGRFVIVSACRWLSTEGAGLDYISINLSPRELAQEDLARFCTEQVQRHGMSPSQLAFEVSDDDLAAGGATARAQVRGLAQGGFRVLVDCFGTGRDALSTWRDLPIAGLKLDPSIAHGLPAEGAVRTAAAGAGLAGGLRIDGIACGIEQPEQEAELRRLGWEYGQGFLFARPTQLRLAS